MIAKDSNLPSAEELRAHFTLDASTGRLSGPSGATAGKVQKNGYVAVSHLGRSMLAHRVIWCMHTGSWPAHQIDHINGDKADNRPENLRDVHSVANCQNQHKARRNNRSGALGVSQYKSGKFVARIYVDGERVYLGSFDNQADAQAAYSAARKVAHIVVRHPSGAARAL